MLLILARLLYLFMLPIQNVTNNRCFNLQNKKPITPNAEELKLNPPSRSAKLRYAVKISNECNFEEFIQKFKKLLDIENLEFNK